MNTKIRPSHSQWNDNKDLKWDLAHINQYAQAVDFLRKFESTICVYSPAVQQLYAKYEVHIPDNNERNVVIIPDFYAHTERFFGIPNEAVVATGIKIVPGEMVGKEGIHLVGASKRNGNQIIVPLAQGLQNLMKKNMVDGPFLPLLTRGDLREYRKKQTPYLHLHRLRLSEMKQLSIFEQRSIAKMIQHKMMTLLQGPAFVIA